MMDEGPEHHNNGILPDQSQMSSESSHYHKEFEALRQITEIFGLPIEVEWIMVEGRPKEASGIWQIDGEKKRLSIETCKGEEEG